MIKNQLSCFLSETAVYYMIDFSARRGLPPLLPSGVDYSQRPIAHSSFGHSETFISST